MGQSFLLYQEHSLEMAPVAIEQEDKLEIVWIGTIHNSLIPLWITIFPQAISADTLDARHAKIH
jgi:hypothetical protein